MITTFRADRFLFIVVLVYLFHQSEALQAEFPLEESRPVHVKKTTDGVVRNILVGAVAGAAAGFMTDVACYPIETVKTRLQSGLVFPRKGFESRSFTSCVESLTSLLSGVEVCES
jgi:hypothetical protein